MHSFFSREIPTSIIESSDALPGRVAEIVLTQLHTVLGTSLVGPFESNLSKAVFAMGCFWGAERRFWQLPGVYVTAVGYTGGYTPNPHYKEVCSGQTGHTEAVLVVFDPILISFDDLLKVFWEAHDPTQGMRQGNDVGTQYRSGIYCADDAQFRSANQTRSHFQSKLVEGGRAEITTEIDFLTQFYYAEEDHQQYLAKNPNGYCGLGGTGVCYE